MAGATIKIDGLDRLNKRLDKTVKKLKNPSSEMRTIANVWMFKDVMDHFSQERSPSGKWASTKRGGRILQDTGVLRNSIRAKSTKNVAFVGTNLDYAATQNYGRGAIKARKFMWLSKEALEKIKKSLGQFFISK